MPARPTGSFADVPPPRRPSLGRAASGRRVPAWLLVLGAIFSVQMGSALTVTLIDEVGPAGAAWLRLSAGALFFVLLSPPKLRTLRRADLPLLLGLGLSTGLMTTCFLAAAARLPLGTGCQAPQQGGTYAGYAQPVGGYGAPGQADPHPGVAQPRGFGVPGAPGYQVPSTPARSFVMAILLQIFLGAVGLAFYTWC